MKQFIAINEAQLDNPTYVAFTGATYNEKHLREWTNDRWGTPLDAKLEDVARDIKQGGWMLFEFISPADPDPERAEIPKIGLSNLIRRD